MLFRSDGSQTVGNYTATLFTVEDDEVTVQVEFNQTIKSGDVGERSTVNGLRVTLEKVFKNAAILGLG